LRWKACAPATATKTATPAECQVDQALENPLHDPRRIADMQVLVRSGRRGNVLGETKQGVAIVVRPEKELTLEWLSHVLECDAAKPHAADSTCPLSLPTAQASVGSQQGHFVIHVRYSDPKMVARASDLVDKFHASRAP
jgi:hypothetical protein